MRKLSKFILIALLSFISISGCRVTSSNNIKVMYEDENKEDSVLLGIKHSINQVNNFSFIGYVSIDNIKYEVTGKAILKDNIADSIIFIQMNDIEIYLKDKHVYIGYMYNGTRIIIKDDLDIFLEELVLILNSKGVKCEAQGVKDVVYKKNINDLDFSKLDYLGKQEGKYIVGDYYWKLKLNDQYLPINVNYDNDKKEMAFDIYYSKTSITIPVGYDIFPLSVGQVKHFLNIDNLADLF